MKKNAKPRSTDVILPLWDGNPKVRTAARIIAEAAGMHEPPARSTMAHWATSGKRGHILPTFRQKRRSVTTERWLKTWMKHAMRDGRS